MIRKCSNTGDDVSISIVPVRSIEELGVQWRALEQRADGNFFNSWHWIGAWLSNLEKRPDVLIASKEGRVVGLACITERSVRWRHLIPRQQIYLNATGDLSEDIVTIEYNEPLAERGMLGEVIGAMMSELTAGSHKASVPCDAIELSGVIDDGRFDPSALGWKWRQIAKSSSFRIDLDALRGSGKSYLEHLSANTRRQIRRAEKLYSARGPVSLRRAQTVSEALDFYQSAAALHLALWQSRGKPGSCSFPFFNAMHTSLIEEGFPAGVVELVKISAGRDDIGYLYNFVFRGFVHYYFSGFKFEDDNRLKPGLLAHALCVQDHLDRGNQCYDFMAGDSRYKASLGDAGPNIATLIAERPRPWVRLEYQCRQILERYRDRRAGSHS